MSEQKLIKGCNNECTKCTRAHRRLAQWWNERRLIHSNGGFDLEYRHGSIMGCLHRKKEKQSAIIT